MKAWFISDIHLKSEDERNSEILLRFLHSILNKKIEATHLFLLGDIFDFWVGNHKYYYRKFKSITDCLTAIQKQNIAIYYIEGNHDVHVISFWKKLGIKCFVEDQYIKIEDRVLRISHGDLINRNDMAYLKYREIIRAKYMQIVAQIIPAQILSFLGNIASRKSRQHSSVKRRNNEQQLRLMIRDYAEKSYQENKFDLIVTGHMHIKDEFKTSNFISINLGSWFETPSAFWWDGNQLGWHNLS